MDSENTEEKKTRTAEIELETHEIATKTTTPLHTTEDRKSTRLNSSHNPSSRMPSSA